MHHKIETKTQTAHHHQSRRKAAAASHERVAAWRPESVSLTRDELRRIVLSQLG